MPPPPVHSGSLEHPPAIASRAGGAWTIANLLATLQAYFATRQIATPRLDAEILLSQILGVSRVYLYTHYDQPVSAAERTQLRALTRRRARYEPIAYIRGNQEFYSRTFAVGPDVLIPRPETEHVVEAVLAWLAAREQLPRRILDVGTGCGNLAITLAAQCPEAEVVATDLSEPALSVARANAATHSVLQRLTFFQGDLFAALPQPCAPFDIVVSNPPYIGTTVRPNLPPDVAHFEPATALFAGVDGLAILRRLCAEAAAVLKPAGLFATEIGFDQGKTVAAFLLPHLWHNVQVLPDLQGHPRVVTAQRAACA